MRTTIRGKNVSVADADREYVERKLRRLDRILDDRTDAPALRSAIRAVIAAITCPVGVGARVMSWKARTGLPAASALIQPSISGMPGDTTLASRRMATGAPRAKRSFRAASVRAFCRP